MRTRTLITLLLLALLPWLLALGQPEPSPARFHPHFPKTLTCQVTKDCSLIVSYQTVTFDAKGAAAMQPGEAWHLAGATFETTRDVLVGGTEVPAGRYALSARKADGDTWELVLHNGPRFSTPKAEEGEKIRVLPGTFTAEAPLLEHLGIDIQPAGDKEHTRLFLEVRFDRLLVRTAIDVPE